jgi:hypothetical protein
MLVNLSAIGSKVVDRLSSWQLIKSVLDAQRVMMLSKRIINWRCRNYYFDFG